MKKIILTTLVAAMLAPAAVAAPPKPVKIYIVAGQSNAEDRQGTRFLAENFPELAQPRNDVWRMRPGFQSPTPFMGPRYRVFGVEHTAGYMLGDALDNDVLFIRSAVGGTMLHTRWRPPSAVKRLGGSVGDLYDTMIRRVHDQLAHLEEFFPPYRGQGFELAGFIWFQGENDCCAKTQGFYRDDLMDLIGDVRTDLGVANLPFVIVKINDGCWGPPAVDVWAAEEYAAHHRKNVYAVNTRDLRSLCHYDPQSYVTIGRRLGKVLVPLAKTPVHVGDAEILAAGKAYFARTAEPSGTPDMTSLRKGLVDYWKFNEGEGNKASSAIDGGTDGGLFSRPAGSGQWVRGKFGMAVRQTSGQSITFRDYKDPVGPDGKIHQMSIAFWAKTPGGHGEYRIGKGKGRSFDVNSGNWFLSRHANTQGWDVRSFDGGLVSMTGMVDGPDAKPATFGAFARDGFGGDGVQWHHQVVVYDGDKKQARFYTDGKLVETARTTVNKPSRKGKPTPPSIEAGPLLASEEPLVIGGIAMDDPNFDFQVYDELAIWSRPLTDEEIAKLYNGGAGAEIILGDPMNAKSLAELRRVMERDIDPGVRYRAELAAGDRGEAAEALLVAAMNHDKSYGIRNTAARLLGEMGRCQQARALAMLKSDDNDTRVLGTVMLRHMARKANPAKTVPALVEAMNDKFFDVREGAADALGALGVWAAEAVPALLASTRDSEWWVRDSAHKALTAIRTPEARAGMIDALDRDRHSVTWFQTAAKLLEPIKADPKLHDRLAISYAKWLCKGGVWTAPFAARGKFGYAVRGLQEMVKAKQHIPAEVGKTIQRILDGTEAPLWNLDDRNTKALEDILAAINKSEGATK